MDAGAEARRDAEFLLVSRRQFRHPVFNRKEALQRAGVPLRVDAERPGDDHRVADIGVHLAAIFGYRLVDIEKEFSDQIVDPELAHLFGKSRRGPDIEKHDDVLFALWPMVSAKQKAAEDAAADQPPKFEDSTDYQR